MEIRVFNAAVLIGWLLVLVGGMLIHPGAGMVGGGVLLLVLVFLSAHMAGGIYRDEGRG